MTLSLYYPNLSRSSTLCSNLNLDPDPNSSPTCSATLRSSQSPDDQGLEQAEVNHDPNPHCSIARDALTLIPTHEGLQREEPGEGNPVILPLISSIACAIQHCIVSSMMHQGYSLHARMANS